MLTAQKLDEMQRVNIGAVAADTLADVSGLRLDNTLSRKERLARFLNTVENPYCFCVGGVGVKIEFAEGGTPVPLRDKVSQGGGILDVPPGQSYNIGVM